MGARPSEVAVEWREIEGARSVVLEELERAECNRSILPGFLEGDVYDTLRASTCHAAHISGLG